MPYGFIDLFTFAWGNGLLADGAKLCHETVLAYFQLET